MLALTEIPDWEAPPPSERTPGHEPGGHRDELVAGWKCQCGSPTLASTTHGSPTHSWHKPVLDEGVCADPATTDGDIIRHAEVDEGCWAAILNRTDHSRDLVAWLVNEASGFSQASEREWRWSTLLKSSVPLTEDNLATLTLGDSATSVVTALALLEHPSATMGTICALLGSLMNSGGYPRFEAKWGGRTQERIVEVMMESEVPKVALATKIRRTGLRQWADFPWNDRDLRLADVRRAQSNFTKAMVDLDQHGDAAWKVMGELLASTRLRGRELVEATAGILEPAHTRHM